MYVFSDYDFRFAQLCILFHIILHISEYLCKACIDNIGKIEYNLCIGHKRQLL